MSYLTELNKSQYLAATTVEGPLLLLAGAGAGKTKTITHRILYLIAEKNIDPSRILAVTFTNKAAKEMRDRVADLLVKEGMSGRGVPFVATFHTLCVHILRRYALNLGLTRHFTIYDRTDSLRAVKQALKEAGIESKQFEPRTILSAISRQKGNGVPHTEFAAKSGQNYFLRTVASVWERYDRLVRADKALDFDDLLLETLLLLRRDPTVLQEVAGRFDYVHVDEYQDTNAIQNSLMKAIAGFHRNICVVGDIDQCLPKNTSIQMANGAAQPIETIQQGDAVLTNYGSGDCRPGTVLSIQTRPFAGEMVRITLASGNVLSSTPLHMHFAGYRLGVSPQYYFTYLMLKEGVGFRLGVSAVYTKAAKKPMVGFQQRCNQEHADAVWVVGVHQTPTEARVAEYTFSLRYGIPTLPFVARKGMSVNGYVNDQKTLLRIFASFDTTASGYRLLSDLGLARSHPHHRAQATRSNRRNIVLTLCGDRRGTASFHRISIVGSDREGKQKLAEAGYSVRKAKKESDYWRFETGRVDYAKLVAITAELKKIFPDATIIEMARLGKGTEGGNNSLPIIPAGSVLPGMAMFGEGGAPDIVTHVERTLEEETDVFDLSIEGTHNFLANNIHTHNSIYTWRGATVDNIFEFERQYPEAATILLEENYRSTKTILAVANDIIKKNVKRKEKNLFTNNKDGDPLSLFPAYDEADEAEFIAQKARVLIEQGAHASDIAVLYRANFQSRALEEAFIKAGVPYRVLGTRFFDRKEIKDILSYLRASLNPASRADIARVINEPARGIGKVTLLKVLEGKHDELNSAQRNKVAQFGKLLQEIQTYATTHNPSVALSKTMELTGIQAMLERGKTEEKERLENLKELVSLAAIKYDPLGPELGMESLLSEAALATDQDELERSADAVSLMTVHAAKGLEFPNVFITGLEEGLFPHERYDESADDEEERRLFYVAVTRAKEKIYLTYANVRTIFGSRQVTIPSEFITDIDDCHIVVEERSEPSARVIYID